jgi:hypothetical protein
MNGLQLASRILQAAATKNAPAALAALDELPEELRTPALNSVLTGWMSNNPIEALDWALANGVEVADRRAVGFDDKGNAGWSSLIGVAFGHDRAKTLEWLRAQPASPQRDAMLMEAIRSSDMVGQNATSGEQIAIYNELAPEVRVDMAPRIVHSLSYEELGRAKAWVKEQPLGEARSAAVQALTERQLSQYPDRAETLADAWPAGPDRDSALSFLGENVGGADPQRAMSFLQRIGDPGIHEEEFKLLARQWLARDATAARVWLGSTTEISAEAKSRILSWFNER